MCLHPLFHALEGGFFIRCQRLAAEGGCMRLALAQGEVAETLAARLQFGQYLRWRGLNVQLDIQR